MAAVPPSPTRWVTDDAGFLSLSARERIDGTLEAYEKQSGHQLLVWIGATAGGVPVEDVSVAAFGAWRVGRKGLDDGLVLFVFADDRKVGIEVGYGLEGQVPDAVASRIIRETIVPRIQAGDGDGAIAAGVDAIMAAIERKPSSPAIAEPSSGRSPPFTLPSLGLAQKVLIVLAVIAFVVRLITHPSLALYLLFTTVSGNRGNGSSGRRRFGGGGGRSGGGGATGLGDTAVGRRVPERFGGEE